MKMTELVYAEERIAMMHLFEHTEFETPTFVFGGVLINEDAGAESAIVLRSIGRVDRGRYFDMTKEFIEYYEPRFKAIQEGRADSIQ